MAANRSVFSSSKNMWRRIALLILLGIAVHLILPQITALKNSVMVLTKMLFWAVIAAFISQVFSYLGSGYLLQKTLGIARQSISLTKSTLIVLGAASVSMVAAGTLGSSAAIYHWTSGRDGSVEGATLASLLPSLFNNMILVFISMIGLVHLILTHTLTQLQLVGFSITLFLLGLVTGLGILAVHYRDHTTRWVIAIAGLLAHLRHQSLDQVKLQSDLKDIFSAWDTLWHGDWHKLLLGGFLNVLFDMGTLYFLFIASGVNISLGGLVSGYGLPLLLGKIAFVLPGGVGVVESSMAALYNGFGISNAITVVTVLGYRLISFWIPSLLGFVAAAYLSRKTNHVANIKK